MSNIQRKGVGSKPTLQLITCIEELANNLEHSYTEIGQSLINFKKKIGELKETNFRTTSKNIRQNKQILTKRKAAVKKNGKKAAEKIAQQQLFSIQKHQQAILEDKNIPIVTIDDNDQARLIDETFNSTLDFQICDSLLQDYNDICTDPLWKDFYQLESLRIKKIDPLASAQDINKFVEDKWRQMNHLQRQQFIQDQKKKKQGGTLKSTKKATTIWRPERPTESRFDNFLIKKASKPGQIVPTVRQGDDVSKNNQQHKVIVNISELVQAIQNSKQEKEGKIDIKIEPRLKRIFQNFQL